jgi:ParB-like chromosome segregation protein Spo0J
MAQRKGKAAGKASTSEPQPAASAPPAITGAVVLRALDSVEPNDWNPNRMTERQVESTRDGFRRHGWLSSQALLIWGTDERGRKRDVIIDGEHRWRIARELGMQHGPMVFLERVSLARAKELTVELDNKRGRYDDVALGELLRSLGPDDGLAFRLGFDDDTFKALIEPEVVLPPGDFSEVTIDAKVDYHCPKCGYEWSGQSSSKKRERSAAVSTPPASDRAAE